jgi:hypothetical protein
MADDRNASPYAVPVGALEESSRVAPEDLTTAQPSTPPDVTDADWLDARRQARLAGGS